MASTSQAAATRFIILTTQRSGSNWLADRLRSHPQVEVDGELFRRSQGSADTYYSWQHRSTVGSVLSTALPAVSKNRYLAVRFGNPALPATGFRLMYDQLRRNPSLLVSLPHHDFSVLHLVRENVLDTHVSALAANASGKFISRGRRGTAEPVVVPTSDLVEQLERRMRLIRRHRRLVEQVSHLEVIYEEAVADPSDHDHCILSFLGVDTSIPLSSGLKRLLPPQTSDRIANLSEVTNVLANTAFAKFLKRHGDFAQ